MQRPILKCLVTLMVLGLCAIAPGMSFAADYPDRPVTFIVPFSPGGGTDMLTRTFTSCFEKYAGKPAVVVNKAGGGGTIAHSYIAHARPDGYTVLLDTVGCLLVHPLYGITDYIKDDLQPVCTLTSVSSVLVVSKKSPIKTLEQYIATAKKQPRSLSITVSAVKGIPHLGFESFARKTGIKVKLLPQKGGSQCAVALLGGHVDSFQGILPEVLPYIESGDFIPLAVFSKERIPQLPNVRTLTECGIDVNFSIWFGLAVPKGTPEAIVKKLDEVAGKIAKDPAYTKGLKNINMVNGYINRIDSAKMWEEEAASYEEIVKALGLYMKAKKK